MTQNNPETLHGYDTLRNISAMLGMGFQALVNFKKLDGFPEPVLLSDRARVYSVREVALFVGKPVPLI